jgi:hypothetical protein
VSRVENNRGQDNRDKDSKNPWQGTAVYRTCSATGSVSRWRAGSRFTR